MRLQQELQNHGIREEDQARDILIKLSKELSIPLVATNDNHYSVREHSDAHDILFCCGMGKFKSDQDRHRYEHEQFYIKTADEMYSLFKETPEAIENTVKTGLLLPARGRLLGRGSSGRRCAPIDLLASARSTGCVRGMLMGTTKGNGGSSPLSDTPAARTTLGSS